MMVEYYILTKQKHTQGIATAALWHCSLCGAGISGMGGPSNGTICVRCGDAITTGKFDRGELICEIKEP